MTGWAILASIVLVAFGIAIGQAVAGKERTEADDFTRGQFAGISAIWLDLSPEEQVAAMDRLNRRWNDPMLRSQAVALSAYSYHEWKRNGDRVDDMLIGLKERAKREDVR